MVGQAGSQTCPRSGGEMQHAVTTVVPGVLPPRRPVSAAALALAVLAGTWVVVKLVQVVHGARLLGARSYQGAT